MNTYFDKEDFDKEAIYCSKCDNNYTIQCLTCRTPADSNGNPTGKPSDFVEKGTVKKTTVFKQIKAMSIDEFAEWLDKNGQFDGSPWMQWWDENYCNKCEPIKCKYADAENKLGFEPFYNRDIECSYCELEHKCRYFTEMSDVPSSKEIIKMWLESEIDGESIDCQD